MGIYESMRTSPSLTIGTFELSHILTTQTPPEHVSTDARAGAVRVAWLASLQDRRDKLRCRIPRIATMYKSGLVELEAVVAIARHGSFRAAALDLDMSPTAIGNAVASLEKRLGVRLFNRTTRNVALTSAGREYVEAIAPALSDIRNAAQAVADHRRKPTGTLRFSCSLGGGRRLLMPLVIEYRRRYGDMKVEIVTGGD